MGLECTRRLTWYYCKQLEAAETFFMGKVCREESGCGAVDVGLCAAESSYRGCSLSGSKFVGIRYEYIVLVA